MMATEDEQTTSSDTVSRMVECVRLAEHEDPRPHLVEAIKLFSRAKEEGAPIDRGALQQLGIRAGRHAQRTKPHTWDSDHQMWKKLFEECEKYLRTVPEGRYRIFTLDGAEVSCSRALSYHEAQDRRMGVNASRGVLCATEDALHRWETSPDLNVSKHQRFAELACLAAFKKRIAAGDKLV